MFSNDWLRDSFHRDVQSRTQVELPEPPETGNFDVREVLDAPYFFS
jgi:DNA-directed RNA polymerase